MATYYRLFRAILDTNLSNYEASFDKLGMSVVRHAWVEARDRIDALEKAIEDWRQITMDLKDFDGDKRGMIRALYEAENRLCTLIDKPELHDLEE